MSTSSAQRSPHRVIAFYLPQSYPIPENDRWWGQGYTEWTVVGRARPMFPGHRQPRLPTDLGYYDLRVPETRAAQAELARDHGIEGFCYWHYWLGNGKRVLERPFDEVLKAGEPDFPFCLAWANHDWFDKSSRGWKLLMQQEYPGERDEAEHFHAIEPAFHDSRYLRIDNKPIFFLFRPDLIPEPKRFADHWRELAHRSGLPGLYFIGRSRCVLAVIALGVVGGLLVWLQPLVQRTVDHVFYRIRRYDHRLVDTLGQRLRSTVGRDILLPTLVETIATGLRLPFVAIAVGRQPE